MIAEFLGLLPGEVSSRVSLVVPHHGCGREVMGRVSLRVSFGMFLVVFKSRMWLEGVAEDVAWVVVGSVDGGA